MTKMITNINTLNTNLYCKSTVTKNKPLSFKGLDDRFKKEVRPNCLHLQALSGIYPNSDGCVGQLPKELIMKIKSLNSQENISDKIKEVRKCFTETANVLKVMDSRKDFIDIDSLYKRYLKYSLDDDEHACLKLKYSLGMNEYNPEGLIDNLELETSDVLTTSLRQTGVLDSDSFANVKYLDSGKYGDAYSIDFTNEEGENILGKYVIKVYKNPEKMEEAHKRFSARVSDYFSSDKYTEIFRNHIKDCNSSPEKLEQLSKIGLDANIVFRNYYALTSQNFEVLKKNHGIVAEANAAKFLESKCGVNLDYADIIKTYFFDLDNGFSLVKMSDENLPESSKHIKLDDYGLVNKDIKDDNIVCGRLIDYGAIFADSETKVGNQSLSVLASNAKARSTYQMILRISKRSKDEAREKRNELYKMASSNSLPQSKDVLLGLDLTKRFLD